MNGERKNMKENQGNPVEEKNIKLIKLKELKFGKKMLKNQLHKYMKGKKRKIDNKFYTFFIV